MSQQEIIYRVYFKCGTKYDFIRDTDGLVPDWYFWNLASIWAESVACDTNGWLHSIISDTMWTPDVPSNKDQDNIMACPGMMDYEDIPELYEVDAVYVLRDNEVIIDYQNKTKTLKRFDDPLTRFAHNMSPVF